jgi:hypothetical protein
MAMEPGLRALGLDPRVVLTLAKSKQMIVWEEVWKATERTPVVGTAVSRVMEAVASGMWPPAGEEDLAGRARSAYRGLVGGVDQVPTTIAPDA